MSFQEAMIPYNASVKAAVMENTWGHLAPKPQTTYKGYILFVYTAWRQIEPLDMVFENLDSSPWFFSDMNEFIGNHIDSLLNNGRDDNHGVYLFKGTYRRFKNGNHKFSGEISKISMNLLLRTQHER